MALWEYRILTSEQQRLTSLSAVEAYLNGLGREQWEVVSWRSDPKDPLVFTALARRPTVRDWFPVPAPGSADRKKQEDASADRSVIVAAEDVDVEDDAADWRESLLEEILSRLRRSRGGRLSRGVDELARDAGQNAADLAEALNQLGLNAPEKAGGRGPSLRHEEYEVWLSRDAKGKLEFEARPARGKPGASGSRPKKAPAAKGGAVSAPSEKELNWDALRRIMRQNPRTGGCSGSTRYIARALKTPQSELRDRLAARGLKKVESSGEKPDEFAEGGWIYWLTRTGGGEIWLNARPEDRAATDPVEKLELNDLLGRLTKTKRGSIQCAPAAELAAGVGMDEKKFEAFLAGQGLAMPAKARQKGKVSELAGSEVWLNRDAKGGLWLNARVGSV